MKEHIDDLKEFLTENYKYILAVIIPLITIILLIIGYLYSKKVENKVEMNKEVVSIKEEPKENIKSTIKVDIKGAVKKPGVYELEENCRVIDAVNKAGGLQKDADTNVLNLSKKLTDEMVIIVYTNSEIKEYKKERQETKYIEIEKECECPDTMNDACINKKIDDKITIKEKDSESKNTESEEIQQNQKISINNATLDELQTISGIGKSKAESIISYREENGSFKSIEDLLNVNGIGEALFEKIKDYITI